MVRHSTAPTSRAREWHEIGGGSLPRRPAREIELMGDVDELTADQLAAAYRHPVGKVGRSHLVREGVLDRLQDAVQEVGLVVRVGAVRAGVHDPVGGTRGQSWCSGSGQVAKQVSTGPALPGGPAVANPLI